MSFPFASSWASLLSPPLFDVHADHQFRCWNSFQGQWKQYSLSDFLTFKGSEERNEEKQTAEGKPQVIEWLNKGIGPTDKLEGFAARTGVPEDFQDLSPLLSTLFADVVYAHGDWPLICFEIQSEASYEDTLYKLIGVCTDHLRFLMNINNSIMDTCGFVLPKNDELSAVTELRVVWTNFQFHLKFRLLSIEEARDEIKQRQLHVHALYRDKLRGCQRPFSFTLLPLSEQERKQFGSYAKQIRSNSAIIVHDPEAKLFYKYSFPGRVDLDLSMTTSKAIVKPLASRKCFGALRFHVFPEVDRSLSNVASIREHCVEYVRLLYEALESIHKEDKLAHLDVRIDNTCFFCQEKGATKEEAEEKEEGQRHQLLLIDFDRSRNVTASVQSIWMRYESNMYRGEDLWDCGQLDFKQLGLLIASVLDASYDVEKPLPPVTAVVPALEPVYPLLSALIERGEWDQKAYEDWARAPRPPQESKQ